MNIALFSSSLDTLCGYGNITYELCMAYHRRGLDFTLFLPPSEKVYADTLAVPFAVECTLPRYVVRFNLWNLWPHLRTINVSQFDMVHSLLDFPHCVIAARSARKYKKPFLMGSQGTYGVMPLTYQPDRYFLMDAFRASKRILVPSQYTKEQILAYAKEQFPIDIIHNGVNFERFQKQVDTSAIRSKFSGKTILLTVGNFKERRGQDLVLRAMALLKERSDLAYIMVGGGSLRAKMEALAEELGIADRVFFAGQQSGDSLLAHFQASDIYIHTPRVFKLNFEGFGIVYLEASSCGKPIIATDAGGIRDAVVDGQTGIVVPDQDIPAIAKAIETLADDAALRGHLGKQGHTYAKEHDWARIADRFLHLYDTVLHG